MVNDGEQAQVTRNNQMVPAVQYYIVYCLFEFYFYQPREL